VDDRGCSLGTEGWRGPGGAVAGAEETDHEQADIAIQTLAFNHRCIHTDSPKIR